MGGCLANLLMLSKMELEREESTTTYADGYLKSVSQAVEYSSSIQSAETPAASLPSRALIQ